MLKRIISMLSVVLLTITISTSINASDFSDSPITFSSLPVSQVPESILQYIIHNGLPVTNDSVISVQKVEPNNKNDICRSGNSDEAYAIQVKNFDNNRITTDILLNIGQTNPNKITPYNGITAEHPSSWDERLVIRATAVFDTYGGYPDTYFRPIGSYFFYHKGVDGANCNVSYISTRYDCEGTLFEYPSLTKINESCHSITVSGYSPTENLMYSQTRSLSEGYGYSIAGGLGGNAGQFMTFYYTVDGQSNGGYTVKL